MYNIVYNLLQLNLLLNPIVINVYSTNQNVRNCFLKTKNLLAGTFVLNVC